MKFPIVILAALLSVGVACAQQITISPPPPPPTTGTPLSATSVITCAQTGSSVPCVNQNNANILINPSMEIDQTNAGASIALSVSDVVSHAIDGWNAEAHSSTASGLTTQQCVVGTCTQASPVGYTDYLRLKIGTGSATVNVGDYLKVWQPIEANNVTNLAFGSATPSLMCFSWQSESSVAGLVGTAVIQNAALTRSYISSFVESTSANTWTPHYMCFIGDNGGSWVGTGTAASMLAGFTLTAGTTYQVGTNTFRTWLATNSLAASNITQLSKTTSATWDVTGVKLEFIPAGWPLAPTSFVRNPAGFDLNNAQRYNFVINEPAASKPVGMCDATATTTGQCWVPFPTPMATAPSCTITTGTFKVLILGVATTWGPTSPSTNTTTLGVTVADANTWAAAGQVSLLQGGGGSGKIACSSQL